VDAKTEIKQKIVLLKSQCPVSTQLFKTKIRQKIVFVILSESYLS